MGKQNTLLDLMEILKKPAKKLTTAGVIVDASKPYRTLYANDYVVKLKIIDLSFNNNTVLDEEDQSKYKNFKRYFQVFIYSSSLEDAPKVDQIGDIIYLKRYDFSAFTHKNLEDQEMQAKDIRYYSRYYIFKGHDPENSKMDVLCQDSEHKYEPNNQLAQQIISLRRFAREYFSQNSLQQLGLFYGGQKIHEYRVRKMDFDMILRVVGVHQTELKQIVSLEFEDPGRTRYYTQYLDFGFRKGDIVEIRSVNFVDLKKRMILNQYSSIIRIPSYFKDHLQFDDCDKYELEYTEEYMKIITSNSYYNHEDQDHQTAISKKYGSAIKIKHKNMESTKNFTELEKLYRMGLKKYSNSDQLDQNFKVLCDIHNIEQTSLSQALKNYDPATQKLTDYEHGAENKLKTILQIKMQIAETDSENMLDVYIFSYDNNPDNIFEFLEVEKVSSMSKEEFSKVDKEYQQKVKSILADKRKFQLVLNVSLVNQRTFFRVVDTQFM